MRLTSSKVVLYLINRRQGTMGERELISVKKTQLTKRALKEWGEEWTKERRGRELHRLEPSPRKVTIKLHAGLTKELSSLVIQMRTGKIGKMVRGPWYEMFIPRAQFMSCPVKPYFSYHIPCKSWERDNQTKPVLDLKRPLHVCVDWELLKASVRHRVVSGKEVSQIKNPRLGSSSL